MEKYIALLRGINVGGKRKILMADLKSLFEKLQLENISTYIQSGNVLFSSENKIDQIELSNIIEKEILTQFGFEVPVIVISIIEMKQAVKENPFSSESIERLHLTFLKENPKTENINTLESLDFTPDNFKIHGKSIFLNLENKYHKTKLSNQFFEKKLQTSATTRNWKTVLKLLELSKN